MDNREFVDYSHEVKIIASRPLRLAFLGSAYLFLLLGFIGVFLPVIPTTPFVLLAAFCFARSSPSFYNWLMNHRWFGPALRDWVKTRGIRPRAKIIAISMLTLCMIPTVLFIIPILAVKFIVAGIGLAVAVYLATRPHPK
jgi:uncharacterized membrane protein YbaN (DUF454 family)